MRFRRRRQKEDAELNITAFMNLMIVLVPVLLMGMVFSRITVLDLVLPDAADPSIPVEELEKDLDFLEVVIHPGFIRIYHPAGVPAGTACKLPEEDNYDYAKLSKDLQQVKIRLEDVYDIEKSDIVILSQPDTDYQTIVSTMDTVRSYQTVVVASVVEAALFPDISLGDAPVNEHIEDTVCAATEDVL